MYARDARKSESSHNAKRPPQRHETATAESASAGRTRTPHVCPCGGGCPRCQVAGLQLSQSGDAAESEADRMARAVTSFTQSSSARVAALGSRVHSERAACKVEEKIQRKETVGGPETGGVAGHALRNRLGAGEPLPRDVRAFFEPRFGHDLSQVRVHSDARAAKSAQEFYAVAYTFGNDVVFDDGQYNPRSPAGSLLLAHELAHVVQQQRAPEGVPTIHRKERSPAEIQKMLERVRHDLSIGIGVRTNEAFARLREEEKQLTAELAQAQAAEIQERLAANRKTQSEGNYVRSPEATAHLKNEELALQRQLWTTMAVTSGAPTYLPGPPGSPFIDFNAGNLRGLSAELGIGRVYYPQATLLPRGFPAVDAIEAGQRTPLTGTWRTKAGPLPLTSDSVSIQGGKLIQFKTLKNSLPYYQEPGKIYKELSKGLEKLANFEPGTGKSEQVGGEVRRVEATGRAEKKVLHVELETEPTLDQKSQLQQLQEDGKAFGEHFGPGEEIEVVISWPGKAAGSAFKITSAGVAGTAGLALGLVGAYGRQRLAERQLNEEGYAPTGLTAHAGDSWIIRLGAFFRGDQFEQASGRVGSLNMPVWRANIRQKTQNKRPGDSMGVRWQYVSRNWGIFQHSEDVDVTYDKQQDGSWRARPVPDAPEGFHIPDLNTILDPQVGDGTVLNMLSSEKGA